MSTFLDEIKNHPRMRDIESKDKTTWQTYLSFFTKGYNTEWATFIEERNRLREVDKDPAVAKSEFRQIACFPPFIQTWLRFVNEGKEPSKEYLREFIKQHPIFWVKENAFIRRK